MQVITLLVIFLQVNSWFTLLKMYRINYFRSQQKVFKMKADSEGTPRIQNILYEKDKSNG